MPNLAGASRFGERRDTAQGFRRGQAEFSANAREDHGFWRKKVTELLPVQTGTYHQELGPSVAASDERAESGAAVVLFQV